MREWLQRLPPAGRVFTVALLAALGYASWWWLNEQQTVDATGAEGARDPDSYFRDLELVRHDAAGRPEMRVAAAYAEHFRDAAWVHLVDLEARGLEAGPDWRLLAEHGRLADDGGELEAWDNVVLTRRTDNGGDGMRLETERLTVNMEAETAMTDEPVAILQGSSRITGRGLWVSLADDRLRIESNVEAHYGR